MKIEKTMCIMYLILLTGVVGYVLYRVETAEYNRYRFDVTIIEPRELRHFKNKVELETFLEMDTTNLLDYRGGFKCLSFAEMLSYRAAENGYRVVVLIDAWEYNITVKHAYNLAYCIEENTYYVIEPQSDMILYGWSYEES